MVLEGFLPGTFLWAHLQPALSAISPEEAELPPGTWFAGRLRKGSWLRSGLVSCQSGQEDWGGWVGPNSQRLPVFTLVSPGLT